MAYHILLHKQEYVRDDSVGLTSTTFTWNYSDRKTYSTRSQANSVVSSLNLDVVSAEVVEE